MRKVIIHLIWILFIIPGYAVTSSNAVFFSSISADKMFLGIGRIDNVITIYDLQNEKSFISFDNQSKLIVFTQDSLKYAYQGNDKKFIIKKLSDNSVVTSFDLHDSISSAAFLDKDQKVLLGTINGKLYLHDINAKTTKLLKDSHKEKPNAYPVLDIKVSPDKKNFTINTRFSETDTKQHGSSLKHKSSHEYDEWLKYGISVWSTETFTPLTRFAHRVFLGHSSFDYSIVNNNLLCHAESGYAAVMKLADLSVTWEPIIDFEKKKIDSQHKGIGCGYLNSGDSFAVISKDDKKFYINIWSSNDKTKNITQKDFPLKHLGGDGKFLTDQIKNIIYVPSSDGGIIAYKYDVEKNIIKKLWKGKPVKTLNKKAVDFYDKILERLKK